MFSRCQPGRVDADPRVPLVLHPVHHHCLTDLWLPNEHICWCYSICLEFMDGRLLGLAATACTPARDFGFLDFT